MADDNGGKKISYSVGRNPEVKAEVDTEGLAKDFENAIIPGGEKEVSQEIVLGTPGQTGDSSRVRTSEAVNSKGYDYQNSPVQRSSNQSNGRSTSPRSSGLDKKESLGNKDGSRPLSKEENVQADSPREGGRPEQTGFGPSYDRRSNGGEKPSKPDTTPEAGAGAAAAPAVNNMGDNSGLEKKDGLDKEKEQDNKKEKPEDTNKPERKGSENPSEGVDKQKKEEPTPPPAQNTGNGYGALNKNRPGAPTQQNQAGNGDATTNARRNYNQNKQASDERAKERGRSTKKASSGTINASASPTLGQRIRNWGRNTLRKKTKDVNEGGGDPNREEKGGAFLQGLGNYLKGFLLRHPFLIIVIILLIFFLIIVLLSDSDVRNNSGNLHCSYDLSGIVSSGSVQLDNLQVELINCDGNAKDYTVLETIDFDKYVVGVALAEVSWHAQYPDYFKAQIVAARGFALRRNSSMCPSNPDNCFFGYNAETGKIRMRACTNDQVYCDIDKPCYKVSRSGKPTIYGPEAEGMAGATVWKGQLNEATKAQILAAAEEVKGKVLIDSSGNVVYTNYINTDQNNWYKLATEGKDYEQILVEHYSSSNATGMSSGTCSNYGNIDYGNYELSSEGDTILNERLDKFLESKGTSLEEFNKLIASNVEKNGYGTRAGVVAAAVTLIAELGNNYNVKVPYFLSGGHHDGVKTGAVGYWGSGYEDDGRKCVYSGYGNIYTVCGLDCSGFVPWAIKNGGFQVGVNLAGNFQNLSGAQKVSLDSGSPVLQPGDLLESEGHIVLVVGIDENTHQYICAEASGKNSGVLFTRRPYSGGSGYWGVKMDGYYDTHSLKGR